MYKFYTFIMSVNSGVIYSFPDDFSDNGLTADKLLNSPLNEVGTILHLAAKVSKWRCYWAYEFQ